MPWVFCDETGSKKSNDASDQVPWRAPLSGDYEAAAVIREVVAINMRVAAAGLGKRAFTYKAQNLTTHSSTD